MGLLKPVIWAAIGLLGSGAVSRAEEVSLELVLAVDVSLSVNDIEYVLQLNGMAAAFRDPDVKALIAAKPKGVAVVMTQWTGTFEAGVPLPWRILRDEADAAAYATALEAVPRQEFGNYTSIGNAISFATGLITTNSIASSEAVIDVSGDGRNNKGPEPRLASAVAAEQAITVNGLAIIADDPGLASYYEENVIAGPGSFVIAAQDFEAFAEAFKRKLKRELSPKTASLVE